MPNSFVTLPSPAGNGTGAAVDTSALGATKTITVSSSGGVYEPLVNVELSNDGGASWSVVASFNGEAAITLNVAAGLMRMSVSRFVDGVVPSVEIGAESSTVVLHTLNVPASGAGAATDFSATGPYKTVQVFGTYGGVVNIEISEDGGVTWSTAMTFIKGALELQSAVLTADFVRVNRVGVPQVAPGTPVVAIASTTAAGGGGGGGGSGQSFVYTTTGAEGSTFNVALPAAMANTNYIAQAVDLGRSDSTLTFYTAPKSGYALNQIQVQAASAVGVGDKIGILLTPTTS